MSGPHQHPNFIQSYFHGTKADLGVGDIIVPGNNANYGERKAKFVYASSNMNVAIWGAELAVGDGPGRIYVVEPVGTIENDPQPHRQEISRKPHELISNAGRFQGRRRSQGLARTSSRRNQSGERRVDLALKSGAPIIED
jgi:rifampin ADP-ribosylating transferase